MTRTNLLVQKIDCWCRKKH